MIVNTAILEASLLPGDESSKAVPVLKAAMRQARTNRQKALVRFELARTTGKKSDAAKARDMLQALYRLSGNKEYLRMIDDLTNRI